jgi:hypothetical protein
VQMRKCWTMHYWLCVSNVQWCNVTET